MKLKRLDELPKEVYEHYKRNNELDNVREARYFVGAGKYGVFFKDGDAWDLWDKDGDAWRYEVQYK